MSKKAVICIYILFFSFYLGAQNTFYQYLIPDKKSKKTFFNIYTISTDKNFTGIVLQSNEYIDYSNFYILSGKDTFKLKADEELLSDRTYNSNLVVFRNPVNSIQLHTTSIKDSVKLIFINDNQNFNNDDINVNIIRKKKEDCVSFSVISQDDWRDSLPEPDYARIIHEVMHIIIHHSATRLVDTNYRTVVRNIYIYHTQVNGWSDIGYNYLIAPNGDIYTGRDPDIYEQDEVMGAHFCGHNSGAMGICLLGDYSSERPTDKAIFSLNDLISWKLIQDSLNPMSVYSHFLNKNLSVISGHRDGCATICPGDMVYQLLDSLRETVNFKMESCGYVFDIETAIKKYNLPIRIISYGNKIELKNVPADIKNISLYSILGQQLPFQLQKNGSELTINLLNHYTGLCVLTCYLNRKIVSKKLLLK